MAKTNHPRKPGRMVHISRQSDGKTLACRRASSLKQALVEYYKETLSVNGWTNPIYKGNTLSVEAVKPGGPPHAIYIATEVTNAR